MSSKRQAVISIGLYQFIGTIDECLAVDELMQSLNQVESHWVHDQSDNTEDDPLPDNYWTIQSEPRAIKIEFIDRDATVISETNIRHINHMKYRKARWDSEAESKTDETSDES
tara:strand:- start:466 stop:804 length:339 start_codon:yes stop_codon:yes gene_type:complete